MNTEPTPPAPLPVPTNPNVAVSKTTIRAGSAVLPPKVSSKEFREAFRRLQTRKPHTYPDGRANPKDRLK